MASIRFTMRRWNKEGRIVLAGHLQYVTYIGDFFPVIKNQGFIAQLDSSAHLNWSKTLDVNEINGVTVTNTGDYATVGSDGQPPPSHPRQPIRRRDVNHTIWKC